MSLSDGRTVLLVLEGPDAPLLFDAVERAGEAIGLRADEVVVLVDHDGEATLVDEVRARGWRLALPVDDRSEGRFGFTHGDDFGRHIERFDPDVSTVRVRWHPDDDPDEKKAQALGLTKLAAWLHETGRTLLVELLVPASEQDLDAVGGDTGRFDREVRPGRIRDAIREIRDLGTEADAWVTDAPADAAEAAQLAELIQDAGRDAVVALVRVGDDRSEAALHTTATHDAYRGAVLEPGLWSDELGALVAGERARDDVVRTLADRFARIIDLPTAAPPA